MMTQPIRIFEALTSEPASHKVVEPKLALSFDERRGLEERARYIRAEVASAIVADAVLWVARQIKAVVAWFKADMQMRAAEDQLRRMSDRELADLGLSRTEIEYAVRHAEGIAPVIATPTTLVAAANQNLRKAA